MTKRRAKRRDEYLPNGSVIHWSQRFRDGMCTGGRTRWRVPVRCGGCGQVRKIGANTAQQQGFTGLCRACADLDRTIYQIPRSTLEHLYHEEGLSRREITERLGCGPGTVRNRMRKYGIEARPPGPVPIRVPEAVLQQWSLELAYVVGLVATDGNLVKEYNAVRFPSTDYELIEIYQQCLGISLHVYTDHRPGHLPRYCVTLSDPAYRAFLEDVGLTPAKTKERALGPLKIPDEFFRDFFRGVIDGDGDIGVHTSKRWPNTRFLSVRLPSVCQPFLVWIRDTVARLTGVEGAIHRESGAFRLRFDGSKARRLLSWLYYDPDLPCLHRKHAIWEAHLQDMPQAVRIVIPAESERHTGEYLATHRICLWHVADEENRTLCGRDAAGWNIVSVGPGGEPVSLEDCLHDDRHVCHVCRRVLASLPELDR